MSLEHDFGFKNENPFNVCGNLFYALFGCIQERKNKNGNCDFWCDVFLLQNRTLKISLNAHILWVAIDSLSTFDSIVLDLHFDCNTQSHTI